LSARGGRVAIAQRLIVKEEERLIRLRGGVVAAILILLVGACSSAGQGASPSGVHRVDVKATDQLRFDPEQYSVKAGETVEFVVTNTGKLRHEFYLGEEAAQQEHEKEMARMSTMGQMGSMQPMDEPNGISIGPGETKTLRHTFQSAGTVIAGCHEPGHYPAGMRATVAVS
jgi:uncharacterized cupredoxin-like copper-binding protein